MFFHPHAVSPKRDALGSKTQALFQAMVARQHDFAARSNHAMPREPARLVQRPHHLPRTPGKAGRARNISISGYLALGDGPNGVADDVEQGPTY